ncbi:MAG TPA: 50S ribosomal protein L28 [Alphaproteobacteria bacterium]|nr:50S ribosomal protein L28 [Alphaproteobacteria bacterium]
MSRVCEFTGKRTGVGMKVSHSNRHTKRTFRPNLQEKTYKSDLLARNVTLRLSTRAIRTVDKHNGLDGYLSIVKPRHVRAGFSANATKLWAKVLKKIGTDAKPAAKKAAKAPAKKAAKAKAE